MEEQATFGTMHVKDGWHFSRLADGSVRISKISLKDNVSIGVTEVTLFSNEWQSIIAGMSAYGSSAQAFDMATAFHTASPNLHKTGVDQPPIDNEASKEAFLKHQAEHHAGN